jgi:hypothetical protein
MGIHVSGNGPILTSSGYGIEIDPFSSSSGGGEAALSSPSSFRTVATSTTTAYSEWTPMTGVTFKLYRSTNSDYSSETEIYSGPNSYFSDSELSLGVLYYYRVKATKSGYTDSAYATDSERTMTYLPLFRYFAGGLNVGDNDYGTVTAESHTGDLTKLKSVINASGPDATPAGIADIVVSFYNHSTPLAIMGNGTTNYLDLDSDVSIAASSPFTLSFKFQIVDTGTPSNPTPSVGTNRLWCNKNTTTTFMRWNSSSASMFLNLAGATVTFTIPQQPADKNIELVLSRNAANLITLTVNGVTSANTLTSANAFIINRLFASSTGATIPNQRWLLIDMADIALTPTQLSEDVFGYLQKPAYTPEAFPDKDEDITLNGITWVDIPASGVIEDDEFDKDCSSTYLRDNRTMVFGNKSQAIFGYNFNTHYGRAGMFLIDPVLNKMSDAPVDIPVDGTNTDRHNTPAFFIYDRTPMIVKLHPHYDFPGSKLIFQSFGKNFDFNTLVTKKPFGNITDRIGGSLQYPQTYVYPDGKVYIGALDFTNKNNAILHSNDGLNFFTKKHAASLGSGFWYYIKKVYSDLTGESIWVASLLNESLARYTHTVILRSTDMSTVYNFQKTESKVIDHNNPLTWAELEADFDPFDVSALTGSCRCFEALIDANGEIHLILGDGNGGWDYAYEPFGGARVIKNIVVPGITLGSSSLDTDSLADLGFSIRPTAVDNEKYLYGITDDWRFFEAFTEDKGTTWEFVRYLTEDDGYNYKRLIGTSNAGYVNHHIIIGSRVID